MSIPAIPVGINPPVFHPSLRGQQFTINPICYIKLLLKVSTLREKLRLPAAGNKSDGATFINNTTYFFTKTSIYLLVINAVHCDQNVQKIY